MPGVKLDPEMDAQTPEAADRPAPGEDGSLPRPSKDVPDLTVAVPGPRSSRPLSEAWLGGVCAGLADHLGWSVLVIRVLFVVLGAIRLVGVVVYLALWLVMPRATDAAAAPGLDAAARAGLRSPAQRPLTPVDVGVASALGLLGLGLFWLVQSSGWGVPGWMALAALLGSAGMGLIWWQADHVSGRSISQRQGLARWVAPLLAHWTTIAAIVLGLTLLAGAIWVVIAANPWLGEVGRLLLILGLSLAAIGLGALPWLLRVRQTLAIARDQKMIADARADMAAHLHDSVLQTLALIQRQAGDPRAVASLARRQERELRQWLYGETEAESTLKAELTAEAADVEDVHGVAVDVVTVGDCELTPDLAALVRATREAMVNAARHSGVDRIDVYAEVDDDEVAVFVRDRGRGFDLGAIDEDRMGVRGSIIERLRRAGGRAIIRTAPGEGTEVRLEIPR